MHLSVSRSLRASFLLLVGFVALIALACGSDDSSDAPAPAAETATEATAATPTQAATEPPTEAPAEEPVDEGGSVDENYLRAICVGGNDLQAAMFTAAIKLEAEGGDADDPEVFAELFLEPLAGFLEQMREATPPDDMVEYHTAALAQYEALITLFGTLGEEGEDLEGDPFELLGGMLAGAEEFPTIPEAARARLAGVAEGVPECAASFFLAEFLGAASAGPVDSGSSASSGSSDVDPADEAYVRGVCLAGDAFNATVQQATADLGPNASLDESDPEVFAAVFTEGLRGLAADMREISPPAGVVQYHDGSIARYEEMVALLDGILETLDAGDEVAAEDLARFRQLLGGGLGMPGLPVDVRERVAQAANGVIECYGSGFLLGFLGGGG